MKDAMGRADPEKLAGQLRYPQGEDGRTVALAMAAGNAFMIDLTLARLRIGENDTVLEIGFGGGKHIPNIAGSMKNGLFSGVDMSQTMVDMAEEENEDLIREGKVKLSLGEVSSLPYEDEFFDKIFTVNTVYFWPQPEKDINEIYRVLKREGVFAMGLRSKDAISELPVTKYGYTLYNPQDLEKLLKDAGFVRISFVQKDDEVGDAVCITGHKE